MGNFRTIALAGALSLAAVLPVHAADLLPPPPPMEPYAPPVEIGGGWYLRGDIGFSNQRVEKLSNAIVPPNQQVIDLGFDAAPFMGIGVGYQFNSWLRMDVTGEYRGKATLHGMDTYTPEPNSPTGFGSNVYDGTKSEITGLVNAYLDLGTWGGVTPFIGAGVGYTQNTIDHFRDTNIPTGGVAYGRSKSKGGLAWALYAGLGFQVSKNLTLELGYRYLNLGDAESGDITTYTGVSNIYNPMKFHDIDSHDIKFGLRWLFAPAAPVSMPYPIMTRG
jgi:opacity protein-like surface antigen